MVKGLQEKKEALTEEAVKEGEEFISPVSTKDDII